MGHNMVKGMHTCCGQYVPQEQECPLYCSCSLLVLILLVKFMLDIASQTATKYKVYN